MNKVILGSLPYLEKPLNENKVENLYLVFTETSIYKNQLKRYYPDYIFKTEIMQLEIGFKCIVALYLTNGESVNLPSNWDEEAKKELKNKGLIKREDY